MNDVVPNVFMMLPISLIFNGIYTAFKQKVIQYVLPSTNFDIFEIYHHMLSTGLIW